MLRLVLDGDQNGLLWAAIRALCRETVPELEWDENASHARHTDFRPRLEESSSGRWLAFVDGADGVTRAADAVVGGASAVLLIDEMTLDEFNHALRAVTGDGQFFVPGQLITRLAVSAVTSARTAPADLTSRELEVLRLIARGHSNAEIGAELHISVNTV